MPNPGAYPTPIFYGGPGGPEWSYYNPIEPQYPVDEYVNQNGSIDRLLWDDEGQAAREFEFSYNGLLSEADAAILDGHYDDAAGSFYGFTFVEPRTGVTYLNVHYAKDGFKRSHEEGALGRQRQIREVRLIWSPE